MNRWLAALKLIGIGWFVSACIVLGVIAGHWLDGKLNSGPLLLIVGLLSGIGGAFYGVYRMLPRITNNRDKGNS